MIEGRVRVKDGGRVQGRVLAVGGQGIAIASFVLYCSVGWGE